MAPRSSKRATTPPGSPFGSAAELREVLEALLEYLNGDEKLATVLRAARWRQSFEFTDLDLRLDVAPGSEGDQPLVWTFDRNPSWEPKLVLRMSSADAHDYLRGELSLPVAVARGLVEIEGEGPTRLKYVTLLALLSVPYKRVVARYLTDGADGRG